MMKSEELSKDLNLVKEFEELKLKQKLLIEALNSKNKTEMNKFLLDINAKLDFLVKIFKESQRVEEEDKSEEEMKNNFSSILEKLESLDKKFDENFGDVDKKIEELQNKTIEIDGIVKRNLEHPSSSIPAPLFEVDSELKKDFPKLNEKTKENKGNMSNGSVSTDDKISSKIEETTKNLDKKKKWF